MAVEFFGATSPFGDLSSDGWEPQDGGGPTTTKTRASALGADGDEIRHADHEEQDEVSCTYVSTATTGNLTLPSVGGLMGGYMIENLTVNYGAEFPTMTLNGRKYKNIMTGAYGNLRTYSPSITLPAVAIGVPSAIGPVTCDGARSASYSLSVTAVNEIGGADKLVGANSHDGVETITVESVETITYTDTNGDWTAESKGDGKTNNGATVNSLTLTKHIAHDVEESNSGT